MSSQQQQQEPQGGSRDERNLLQENKEEEKESSLPVARLPSHSHPPHTTTSTTTTNQPSSYDMEDPPEIQRLEDAEDAILSQLEAQSKHTRTLSDGFRPAMMGERPPLGVPSVGVGWTMDFLDDDDNNNTSSNNMDPTTSSPAPVATRSRARRPSFYEMALHVQQENQQQFRPAGTSTAAARRSSFNADPSTQNYSQGDCGGRGGGLTHYNNSRNLMMTGSGSRKAHDLLVRMDRRNSGGKKYPSNPRHQDHGNTAGSRNTGSSGTPTRKANTSAAGGGGGSHELFTDLSQDVFSSTPQRLQQRHEGLSFLWNEDEDESDDDSGSDSYEDEQQQQQQDLMMSTDSTLPPPGYMKNLPPRVSSSSSKGGRSIPPEQRPLLGGEGGGGGGTMDFVGSNNPLRSAQLGEKSSSNDSISLMMTSEQRQQQEQQERAQQHHRRSQERRMKRLMKCWNPCEIFYRLLFVLSHSTLVISIPFFIMAWILYYYLGNPSLDFMPGNATLSWWLDFLGRQLLVFEIAHVTEFLLIDVMVMSSKTVVKMLGPWITIFCLQSKGWPFLLTFWGIYDMILLHGNNRFQRHWLYWTGIAIYSRANSGSYLLSSSLYLRILIGMELAGVTTTLKRTVLTLYFGKRNFDIYKPKLEELLHDIIVITEIAELAAEADALVPPPQDDNDKDDDDGARDTNKEITDDDNDSDNDNDEDDQGALSDIKNKGPLEDTLCLRRPRAGFDMVRWASVTFDDRSLSTESADDIVENVDPPPPPSSAVEASQPVDGMKNNPLGHSALMAQREVGSSRSLTSGVIKIKNLLDRWEEPVNKLDKSTKSSVHDILKFRKALTYMDLENPFGGAFGLASTRDELIKSAQTLYQQLLKLSPGLQCLPYSVLAVLSQNLDGTVDTAMKKSISNLFRADAQGEISMLAFVQTCDVVYRRLRYFRASVGNSSVIDKVLENIVNGFFAIGLTIVILSLLRFNPWPLLVSVSTLLVSFAFAIGPTAAKAIEGIILIAGTRYVSFPILQSRKENASLTMLKPLMHAPSKTI